MPATPPHPPDTESAPAMLTRQLEHVARLHAERAADPRLAAALDRLAEWQAKRLRQTYADLEVQPRYTAAIDFFETDLYGRSDFGARDADVAKVAPLMMRMLPERVVATIAHAMELNALSQELDRAILAGLPRADGTFAVAEYCDAYRRKTDRAARERQIALVAEIGGALDRIVQMPLIHAALVMMRQPARLAGVAALHEFLERGFEAFRRMSGAGEFLATIVARETALMDAILRADEAPFADPAGAPQPVDQSSAVDDAARPRRRRSEPRAPVSTSALAATKERAEPTPRGRTGRGRRPPRTR